MTASPSPRDRTPETPGGEEVQLPALVDNPDDFDGFHDEELAHLPELRISDLHGLPRRRRALPLFLFVATCLSTFWVGVVDWNPVPILGNLRTMWEQVVENWPQGLLYMSAILAILLAHEMGHFLQTVRYRIPASYPLCIPLPINPFGTMGAVIGMDGLKANRREIFDIGIAGPLAGLVVAVPIMWLGVDRLSFSSLDVPGESATLELHNPLLVQWLIQWSHPGVGERAAWVPLDGVNALFMAGWVGMLITGLNMLPVSQLDGGHVIYALFGRDSKSIARTFTVATIVYVVIYLEQAFVWTPMLVLVVLIGIHHPPTSDDTVQLGRVRSAIGVLSLIIPVLCFPLLGFRT
jgi:membrane-associated protease RseP (regulator of RpoE activity)